MEKACIETLRKGGGQLSVGMGQMAVHTGMG
jgi:hypothetical protein